MTKHAYLIIAHAEWPVLEVLLQLLDHPRNDVYLHVDRRASALFAQAAAHSMTFAGYHLLPQRQAVSWGHISQVEVEYQLFETAHAQGPYAYYHLLSGVDLPIKPQNVIHQFFDAHQGKEFVSFWLDEANERDLQRKVSRHYFFTRHLKNRGTLAHALTAPLRNAALLLQKLTAYRRPATFHFRKGSQWVSLTHAFLTHLLAQKPHVMKRFRRTLCPDEIFLQTVLWNSPFRANIYRLDDAQLASMRLIDWQRGSPYVWQLADLPELAASPCLFARKFSSADAALLEQIKTLSNA